MRLTKQSTRIARLLSLEEVRAYAKRPRRDLNNPHYFTRAELLAYKSPSPENTPDERPDPLEWPVMAMTNDATILSTSVLTPDDPEHVSHDPGVRPPEKRPYIKNRNEVRGLEQDEFPDWAPNVQV
jgi:hypothetical protein